MRGSPSTLHQQPGEKTTRPKQEIAMVITNNHTTPSITISSLESPINVYLEPASVWWTPVLHQPS
jgi:hypothetical protein